MNTAVLIKEGLEQMHESLFLLDKRGAILEVNEDACHSLGYARDEFARMNIQEIDPQSLARIQASQGSCRPLVTSSVLKARDGRLCHVRLKTSCFRHDGQDYCLLLAEHQPDDHAEPTEAACNLECLKSILDLLPVGISLTIYNKRNRQEQCLINDGHLRIAQLSREEASVENFRRITHPEDLRRQDALIRQMNVGKRDRYSLDKRYVHPNGEVTWVELSVLRRRLSGDRMEEITVLVDITERKRKEAQLQQAQQEIADRERLYHTITDTSPNNIIRYDGKGKIVYLNSHMKKLLGIADMSAVLGKRSSELCPDGRFETIEEAVTKAVGQGLGSVVEFSETLSEGVLRHHLVRVSPERDAMGRVVGALAYGTDITEQRRMDEALRASEQRFRVLSEASFEGVCISENGCIIDVNDQYCRMFGYERSEMIGHPIVSFLAPESHADFARRIRTDTRSQVVHRGVRKDGTAFDFEVQSKLGGLDGRRQRISVLRDITERKLLDDALRASEERVRNRLKAILSPDFDCSHLRLKDVLDCDKLQELMEKFHQMTKLAIGIVDTHGKVLVQTGWQDICTRFHRADPKACELCVESSVWHPRGVEHGKFKLYKCNHNMWKMVTPIVLGNTTMGNLFLGQFQFKEDVVDRAAFRKQARYFEFNEKNYLKALDKVPRMDRSFVEAAMVFQTALADMIGSLSYGHLKLANTLETLKEANQKLSRLDFALNRINEAVYLMSEDGRILWANESASRMLDYSLSELQKLRITDINPTRQAHLWAGHWRILRQKGSVTVQSKHRRKNGEIIPVEISANYLEHEGEPCNLAVVRDLTRHAEPDPQLLAAVHADNESLPHNDPARKPGQAALPELSTRERALLKLVAEGKRGKEIAVILGIKHSTVDTCRSRLMKKLKCDSAAQLTRRAIREGLIHL